MYSFSVILKWVLLVIPVTQPVVNGPFSCFDASHGSQGHRTLEVDLNDDDGSGTGYLASAITDRTGAGSAGCPWLLRASPWQRINMTLVDFSDAATLDGNTGAFGYSVVLGETPDTALTKEAAGRHGLNVDDVEELNLPVDVDRHRPGDHRQDEHNSGNGQFQQHSDTDGSKLQELRLRTFCRKYAVVRERQPTSSRETVVCGDKARRKVVYLSASNEIEVELVRAASTDDDDRNDETTQPAVFLLRYDSQSLTLL